MQLAANSQLPGSFEGVFLLLERMAAHVNFQDDRPRPARRLNTRDRTEGDTTRKRTTHCDELRSSCCTASTFDFPRDPKHRSRATSGNARLRSASGCSTMCGAPGVAAHVSGNNPKKKTKQTKKTTNKKTHTKKKTWTNTKQQHTKRAKESHRRASQTRSARPSGSQATDAQVQPCPVVCFAILRSAASKHPGARAKAGHCVRAASVRLALTI